ncbi:hypothetical protein MNBD_ALPHA07-414 [hydrothermal vent metagenome]|uniref:Uncharacterized protein n=1 Tax=hydrothermal vent metagenome TaxID=652676 RepID=A0A3B0R510_9ZZZZ
MSDSFTEFNSRVGKINREHTRKERGYVVNIRKDGLIVFKPKNRYYSSSLPLRGLIFLIIGFFLFKGLILAHAGASVYEERLTRLKEGSIVEQAGAYVMQVEPVSQIIATQMRRFLK